MVQDSVGDTALHLAAACMLCEPGVIQTLLTAGADIRIKNYYRDTPMEVAHKNEILEGTRDYWDLVLNAAAVVDRPVVEWSLPFQRPMRPRGQDPKHRK